MPCQVLSVLVGKMLICCYLFSFYVLHYYVFCISAVMSVLCFLMLNVGLLCILL